MSRMKNAVTPALPAPAKVVRGHSTDSIHRAREAARAFAGGLTPAADPDTTDTLVLVVCELVTNALRHGGGRYTLELSAGPDTLTASVSDPLRVPPCERRAGLWDGSGGFGWQMVRRLTHNLTITHGSGPASGKTIHADILR